jgi:hypothetical protein
MTGDEARRRLVASTGFEIRAGLVWLRELRWLGAVAESARERGGGGAIAQGDAVHDAAPPDAGGVAGRAR